MHMMTLLVKIHKLVYFFLLIFLSDKVFARYLGYDNSMQRKDQVFAHELNLYVGKNDNK